MNDLDFTKIRWAGTDCILITMRPTRQAIILTKHEIEELNKVFNKKEGLTNKQEDLILSRGEE
jgi:hypothetical protein